MTAPAMTITALVPWFGSKRTLAARIVAELGEHSAYWEPFCGSMAVLLAKQTSTIETVNDLHGDLTNLARCIRHPEAGPRLYRILRRTLMSEQLHREAAERCAARGRIPAGDEIDVDRAVDYFLTSWFGRNGVSGTHSYNQGFCRRFTRSGGGPSRRFVGAVGSIPAWRRRMRDVTVLNGDAFELLERIEDDPRTAIYCDPPYIEKGAKYVHDFTPDDHLRLAEVLSRFREARVIVSYYDHELVRQMYREPEWTVVSCPTTKSLVNQTKRDRSGGAAVAPEVLVINGPSYTSPALFAGATP